MPSAFHQSIDYEMENTMDRDRTLVVFDIDGTIAENGKIVEESVRQVLKKLRKKCTVALIGGARFQRMQEKLGDNIHNDFDYVFSENGLQGFKNGAPFNHKTIRNAFSEEQMQEMIEWALMYIAKLRLPVKRGLFVDFRTGLVNVSPAGRNLNKEERAKWVAFDEENGVRRTMVAAMKERFADVQPPLEFVIGGQLGFDFFPSGWNKSIVLGYVEQFEQIYFFGDRTMVGGNDYQLCMSERTFAYATEEPAMTVDLVQNIFFGEMTPRCPEPLANYTIGFCMSDKKRTAHHDFIHHLSCNGHKVVALDMDRPIEEQGQFDAIVHKITQVLRSNTDSSPDANAKRVQNMEDYLQRHPECVVIDKLSTGVLNVVNRLRTSELLESMAVSIPGSVDRVMWPKSWVLERGQRRVPAGASFPLITKPANADGSAQSHEISLVYSEEALPHVDRPALLQEFINHGAVLHKIYAIGEHVYCGNRPSLDDVNKKDLKEKAAEFSEPEWVPRISRMPLGSDGLACNSALPSAPSHELVQAMCADIEKRLQLSLFGIDVITRVGTRDHYVIDVNYFPSYGGMTNAAPAFHDHVVKCIENNKRANNVHASTSPAGAAACCPSSVSRKHHILCASNNLPGVDGDKTIAANKMQRTDEPVHSSLTRPVLHSQGSTEISARS
eukprot:TRINITY_DN1107_c0_g1_i1.p1 TRINITY_DN1107_c0_g1~~TRINITY_DN1107_c0_g1_i1.p1  ORF type:complete len:668 (-),score=198.09 TRINITY_DN1107_c0_g1_i1:375-2378(-)